MSSVLRALLDETRVIPSSVGDRIDRGERPLFYFSAEPGYGYYGEVIAFRISCISWDGWLFDQFDVNVEDRRLYRNGW